MTYVSFRSILRTAQEEIKGRHSVDAIRSVLVPIIFSSSHLSSCQIPNRYIPRQTKPPAPCRMWSAGMMAQPNPALATCWSLSRNAIITHDPFVNRKAAANRLKYMPSHAREGVVMHTGVALKANGCAVLFIPLVPVGSEGEGARKKKRKGERNLPVVSDSVI